jgi:hypothetical protein
MSVPLILPPGNWLKISGGLLRACPMFRDKTKNIEKMSTFPDISHDHVAI